MIPLSLPQTPSKMQQKLTKNRPSNTQNGKVQVVLRIRPFTKDQQLENFLIVDDAKTIKINKPGFPSYMKFSCVQEEEEGEQYGNASEEGENGFGNQKMKRSQVSQIKIFQSVSDAVTCIFQGVDSTVFAYGQTGSGKTYTVSGNFPEFQPQLQDYQISLGADDKGILPRSLEMIFTEQIKMRDSRISLSFYEIYNEKIYDLLGENEPNTAKTSLDIRQGKHGELLIPNLSFWQVKNLKVAVEYLAQGLKNRATSATQANIKSSRSHSIFHVKYERLIIDEDTGQHEVLIGNLRIVDLAGSEKFNISSDLPEVEKQLKLLQLKSINGSLSKLGHCISSLTSQSRTHIPFRDSKLTRILSDSLLGSGKIRLIICVSPSVTSMNETSSTLQFADRVKKAIFQKPINQQKRPYNYFDLARIKDLEEELQMERKLRQQAEGMLKQFMGMGKDGRHTNQQSLFQENYLLKQEVALLRQIIQTEDKTCAEADNHNSGLTFRQRQTSKQNGKIRESIKNPAKRQQPLHQMNRSISKSNVKSRSNTKSPVHIKQLESSNVFSPKKIPSRNTSGMKSVKVSQSHGNGNISHNSKNPNNNNSKTGRISNTNTNIQHQNNASHTNSTSVYKNKTQSHIKTPPKVKNPNVKSVSASQDIKSQGKLSIDEYNYFNLNDKVKGSIRAGQTASSVRNGGNFHNANNGNSSLKNKMKSFMQESNLDQNLQLKIRKRLQEIKHELANDPKDRTNKFEKYLGFTEE